MKNIGAGVGVIPTQEQKAGREEEEEDIYTEHRNEMYFYLKEHPEYRISAVGRWLEDQKGKVIEDVDTFFLHITSGQRCDGVRDCFQGWSEQDEESDEKWETLCHHIEACSNLKEIILNGNTIDL